MPPIPKAKAPPGLASIAKGAKTLVYDLPSSPKQTQVPGDAQDDPAKEWTPIVCPFHSGMATVPDPNNPDGGLPSPDVGFQPTCNACRVTALNTIEHAIQRYSLFLRAGGQTV